MIALPTLSEIRAANANVNDQGFVLLTLTRPLGPLLAWVWLRLKLTPRLVNYASILLGIYLLYTITGGGAHDMIIGTGLIFVWQCWMSATAPWRVP